MIVILIILHVILCTFIGILRKIGWMNRSNAIMLIVCLIPFSGAMLAIVDEYSVRRRLSCSKEYEIEKMTLTDKRYRSIEVDDNQNQQITVPLEEAMLINDAKTRRALMLEILHKNPSEYVDMLKRARLSNDVELTHYATTTIMEIQSDYENLMQQNQASLMKEPDNEEYLKKYEKDLVAYIGSGLLSGNILLIQRVELKRILEKLYSIYPDDRNIILKYVDNELELGYVDELESILNKAKSKWPGDERIYMLYVRYYRKSGQGSKIQDLLQEMQHNKVYLTREGKEWFSFFKREEAVS